MNQKRNVKSRKKLIVDPRFDIRIGTFVNSRLEISPPQTKRDPNSTIKHLEFDPSKPKLNLKVDAASYPEEIIGMHTYGYAVAHKRYSENVYESYEKQWEDEERLRRCKSARVRNPIDPIKRRKDHQVVEQIIKDTKKRERDRFDWTLFQPDYNFNAISPYIDGRSSERSSQKFLNNE